jgi:hypothetical protein
MASNKESTFIDDIIQTQYENPKKKWANNTKQYQQQPSESLKDDTIQTAYENPKKNWLNNTKQQQQQPPSSLPSKTKPNEQIIEETVDEKETTDEDTPAPLTKKEKIINSIKSVLKFIAVNFGLLIILGIYTSMGALLFIALEQYNELTLCFEGQSTQTMNAINLKTQIINYIKNNVSMTASDSSKDNSTVATENLVALLVDFRNQVLSVRGSYYYTGQDCSTDSSVWNFLNVLLFTITIVSTIGYGQISPKTVPGQLFCICYAILGIPIFVIFAGNISGFLAKSFRLFYSRILCGICYISKERKKKQEKLAKQQLEEQKRIENGNKTTNVKDDEEEEDIPDDGEDDNISIPLTITITMIILYLLLGSYIFSYTEGWPGMTGFYFSYVTLSTIGFGDYSPGQNLSDPNRGMNLAIGLIYIGFGLSLLSMSFDLMQGEIIEKFVWIGSKLGFKSDDDEEGAVADEEAKDDEEKKKKEQKQEEKKGIIKKESELEMKKKPPVYNMNDAYEMITPSLPPYQSRFIRDNSNLTRLNLIQRQSTSAIKLDNKNED